MQKNKILVVASLLLGVSVSSFAGDRKVELAKKLPAFGRESQNLVANPASISARTLGGARQPGPGLLISESSYDLGTNSAMPRNIHNYGDGTLAIARMLSQGAIGTWPDRGTFFVYNDGTGWILPPNKVEAVRTGWGNISAFTDGRSAIAAHQTGIEVNVDALQGLAIWTSYIADGWSAGDAGDLSWPRIVVDGADNIHVIATYFTVVPNGVDQPVIYLRSTDGGLNWEFRYLFQSPGIDAQSPPDTVSGLWLTDGDADSYAIDAFGDKVGVVAWTFGTFGQFLSGQDILFGESTDNGQTWTFTNITDKRQDPPSGDDDYRPTGHLDLLYDRSGEPHIVWGTFLAAPLDTLPDGTIPPGAGGFVNAPIQHWSPSLGITNAISRFDIPGAEDDSAGASLTSSSSWGRGLGNGLFWPSLGVDANNRLYLTFNAPTPGDYDASGVNYIDVYATASANGGNTWGAPPANVTSSLGTEDKYASLAKLVDDSLRITYFSDDFNGVTVPGVSNNQTINSSYLYLGFSAAEVPTERATSVDGGDSDTRVPADFALAQNFPNPFNPSTSIAFSLPASVNVKLEVYNMIGQKVATLANGKLAAGNHTINWNAQDVPSGIYFYKLEAANFSQTRKMLLMK